MIEVGIGFSSTEWATLTERARERWQGKANRGIDASISRGDGVELNTIGIIGEVLYARYCGVWWYQNPGEGGDHHRQGDLELRDGKWLEVKTSRNPKQMVVHHTDKGAWDLIGFCWWNPKLKLGYLRGFLSRAALHAKGKTKVGREQSTGRSVSVTAIDPTYMQSVLWLEKTLKLPRAKLFHGAMCPWCMEPIPRKHNDCLACLKRREAR